MSNNTFHRGLNIKYVQEDIMRFTITDPIQNHPNCFANVPLSNEEDIED